ncbi:MAG: hypothetical protein IT204_03520 [Fimbriimonadaceae bacterium]|nr:hypothetical protein [Fimbriimonadaceae bacterium]
MADFLRGLLMVLGALTLVALLLLGVAWWRIRRTLRRLGEVCEGLVDETTPGRITLQPDDDPEWDDDDWAAEQIALLTAAGFEPCGTFGVDPMPGLLLAALVHPAESTYAVIYELPAVCRWVELVTCYDDDGMLTVSSSPHLENLDAMPGRERVVDLEADSAGLLELWRAAVRPTGRRPAKAEWFVAEFEQAYAAEMAWRDQRGGPTEEEVRRIAAQMDDPVDDADIAATVRRQAREAHLREAARAAAVDPDDDDESPDEDRPPAPRAPA